MFKNSGQVLEKVRELCANKEEFISKMDFLNIKKDNKSYQYFGKQVKSSDLLLTDEIKNQNKDNIFNSFKCLFDGLSGKVKLLKCGSVMVSNGLYGTVLIFENSKRYRIDYLNSINSFCLCQLNDGNEIDDSKVDIETIVGFKIS